MACLTSPTRQSGGGFGIQASANGGGGTISVDGHQLNVSAPAFQKAMQDCQKYQPQGPPISGAQLAKIKQGALKMAECMRAHGVAELPGPEGRNRPWWKRHRGFYRRPGRGWRGRQVESELASLPERPEDLHAPDARRPQSTEGG